MEYSALRPVAKIGEGGMCSVWKAVDPASGSYFALKRLNDELLDSPSEVEALKNEARLLTEIRHPGVVRGFAYAEVGGYPSIVLEYVDGYNFADLLKRKQHIGETDALLICESVAAALDMVWNDHGIVHCDLKPENIMINTDGVVKLTDLGISHRFQFIEGSLEVPEHVTGTPAYISPEQIYGDVELDCRSDIYSLGATLYHLTTGRVLFPKLDNDATMRAHCDEDIQAKDPRLYRPSLSEGFAQLLEAMLVKNRDGRIPSWSDIFAMCREIESGAAFKPRQTPGVSSILLAGS